MAALQPRRVPVVAGVPVPLSSSAVAAGVLALVCAGAVLGLLFANRTLAAAVPFAAVGAALCLRGPAVATVLACVAPAFTGTITAYFAIIPPKGFADIILVCLFLSVLWAYTLGGRSVRIRPWPGLGLIIAYLLLTVVAIVVSEDAGRAFESFELAGLYIAGFLLITFAPWDAMTRQRIARGIVIVGILAGAYCALRYAIGSSTDELIAARAAQPSLPRSEELRFFGTFLTAQDLAGWSAVMIPLGAAAAAGWSGRWRLAGLALLALCAVSLFASDVRTGVAAAAAGLAVTGLLFTMARAFPSGHRIGAGFAGLVALIVIGVGGYAVTVASSPETAERFEALLDPGDDPNFEVRQQRWEAAWNNVTDEPFGHGLGRTGTVAARDEDLVVGPPILDSSYLKVGIEQGLVVMVIYIAALATLLLGLAFNTIRTHDRQTATLGIAACGTTAALMVLFYGSMYAESPSVVTPAWIVVGLGAAGFTTFVAKRSRAAPHRS